MAFDYGFIENTRINEKRRFFIPLRIQHIGFYGITGTGKSVGILGLCCQEYLNHVKVWHLFDGGRGENCFYLLPSKMLYWIEGVEGPDKKIWKSRNFPTDLAFPNTKQLPDVLPKYARVFTLPLTKITIEDIRAILGSDLTANEEALWEVVSSRITPSTTVADLKDLIFQITDIKKGIKTTFGIISFTSKVRNKIFVAIDSLDKQGLLSSEKCETSMDIWEEYHRNTIFSLVLRYCDDKTKYFLVQWFCRNIIETLKNRAKKPSYIVLDEARQLIPRSTDIPEQNAIKRIIEKSVTSSIRDSMVGFIIGCQNPSEISGVRGNIGVSFCFKIKYVEDMVVLMNEESKDYFDKYCRSRITRLQPGYCFVFTDKGRWYGYCIPPMCDFKKAGDDFFTIWRRLKGEAGFINVKKQKEATWIERKIAEKRIEELRRLKDYKANYKKPTETTVIKTNNEIKKLEKETDKAINTEKVLGEQKIEKIDMPDDGSFFDDQNKDILEEIKKARKAAKTKDEQPN